VIGLTETGKAGLKKTKRLLLKKLCAQVVSWGKDSKTGCLGLGAALGIAPKSLLYPSLSFIFFHIFIHIAHCHADLCCFSSACFKT